MSANRTMQMSVAVVLFSAVSVAGHGADRSTHSQEAVATHAEQAAVATPGDQKADKAQPPPRQRRRESQARSERLPQRRQDRLVGEQRQRLSQYRDQMAQQQRLAPQQGRDLQRQKRTAQFQVQLQYTTRLREQQRGIQNDDAYDYDGDPYFYTPSTYRYSRGGREYETNEYGAGVLRQAVNSGYEMGFGVGDADREDHWRFSYQDSYAYRDGIYGYRGFYVERADYRYYFQQGFRRGYEDGYYARRRYGASVTGQNHVFGPVLSLILNLRSVR